MPQSNENTTPFKNKLTLEFNTINSGLNLFKGKIKTNFFTEASFKGRIKIKPVVRLYIKYTGERFNSIYYKGKFSTYKEVISLFKGSILVPPRGVLHGKVKVLGYQSYLYKGRINSSPGKLPLFKGKINVPVFTNTPEYKGKIGTRLDRELVFKGTMFVGLGKSFLYGKVKILGFKEYQYQGKLIYKKMGILNNKGKIQIPIFNNTINYKGSIINKLEKYKLFKGTMFILVHNRMYGLVQIHDTPMRSFYGDLIKDAYTNANKPEHTFSKNLSLLANRDNIIYLQWRFNRNKDDFYLPKNETHVYLKWDVAYALNKPQKIKIGIVRDLTWKEHFLNHNNKPPIEEYREFLIPANYTGELNFDLGKLFQGVDKLKEFNYSLAVSTDSTEPILTNSRETSVRYPSLYYDYFYVPPVIRLFEFGGRIHNRIDKDNLYKGKIFIESTKKLEIFKSKIEIPKFENDISFKGMIEISSDKEFSFKSKIEIPKFDRDYSYGGKFGVIPMRLPMFKGQIEIEMKSKIDEFKGQIFVKLNERNIQLSGKIFTNAWRLNHYKGSMSPIPRHIKLYKGKIKVPVNEVKLPPIKGKIQIPIFDNTNLYKGKIDHFLTNEILFAGSIGVFKRPEFRYKGRLTIPLLKADPKMYKAKVAIQYRYISLFKSSINIPLFESDNPPKYKGKLYNIGLRIRYFKCSMGVVSDKKKVRIFIM